ncbi:MAG: insulinase family protein [Deltaproteobacteria bacterium]|nr:insulinase family protein [Deltaproteobacteria bacterium]
MLLAGTRHRLAPLLSALSLILLLPIALVAGEPATLVGRVQEHRLANGLTVLALHRPGAPTVSLQMTFLAGGVDEPSGRTGMAHLLEHLLFKGTTALGTRDWSREKPLLAAMEEVGTALDEEVRRTGSGEAAPDPAKVAALRARLAQLQEEHRPLVVKDEIDALYARVGATGFNASTAADLTSYTVSLPSNRLELWARIESERMADPVLREYYLERDVVAEERRQRSDADPSGRLYEVLLSTAFAAHPYGRPVIGWPSDVETLELRDTREFFQTYYGPNNAVVAAVGDVDPAAFFALVDRTFGPLPAVPAPRRLITEEPLQPGPRRVEVEFDAEPRLIVAYHKPTLPHRDDYVFDVIESLLAGGRSSRLVRELVDRRRVASSVDAVNGTPGARYPNLFAVFVTPAGGTAPAEVEAALEAELRRLAEEPPSREELDRVTRQLEASRVKRLISNRTLAGQLAYFQAVAGDWRYVEEHPKVLATVTPEEVSRVASRYFTAENRTVALLRPPERAEGAP